MPFFLRFSWFFSPLPLLAEFSCFRVFFFPYLTNFYSSDRNFPKYGILSLSDTQATEFQEFLFKDARIPCTFRPFTWKPFVLILDWSGPSPSSLSSCPQIDLMYLASCWILSQNCSGPSDALWLPAALSCPDAQDTSWLSVLVFCHSVSL